MPRHTHPEPRAKHGRAHTRAQRDRYIERRFRRAKREGILDHVSVRSRFAGYSSKYRGDERTHDALQAFLEENGALTYTWGARENWELHPNSLFRLPAGQAGSLRISALPGPATLGRLSDRLCFYKWTCNCFYCNPVANPSYRGRERNLWRREVLRELIDREAAGVGADLP